MSEAPSPRGKFDELALLRAWNNWNSKSLLDYSEAIFHLSPQERKKGRRASWGSIQDVLLHVVEDYIWWYENVPQGRGKDPLYPQFVGKDYSDIDLRVLVQNAIEVARAFVDSLTPDNLGQPYEVHGTVSNGAGKHTYTMTTCPADIVWHMVEEQLQHIGEINALLWQLDIDPHSHAWFSSQAAWTH
ncbi:MAG: hypothetical protein JRN15_04185 [Nitrososphaerota archaeon]|nr:hypothetical protein [Nitrososphaerota archaeon]